MEYSFCGHSGLQLPKLSLGLWHNFGDVDIFDNAKAMVLRAFDKGITHFDLANNYGPPPGSAEENFGKILKQNLGSHRDEIIVSSKAGHDMWDGPYGRGSSRKHLIASIDQSLRRTGLEYFDIFYTHVYNKETPWEETAQTLVDIVKNGKALYIGISKYPVEIAEKLYDYMVAQHVRPIIYQDKYNMINRAPEAEHVSWIKEKGLGFICFSPLAQGLLTNRYLNGIPADSRAARSTGFLQRDAVTNELVERLLKLNAIAADRGQSLAQLALSWLLSKDVVTSVLIGASSVAQLDDNLRALDNTKIAPNELEAIDDILLEIAH